MASVGHIVVGMAAARAYHRRVPQWSTLALWSALSLLPDADAIGFSLGIRYGAPWGHRGATHSFVFSVALGLTIGLAFRWFNRPAGRIVAFTSVLLASHPILDTMTDGGLGCALFWPLSLVRHFAPWRPIPVAPIGLAFFSPYGGIVALTELVLFSPLLLFALRPARAAAKPVTGGLCLALWLISAWLLVSGDPIREAVVGFIVREDTAYASGFSEPAFRTITPGAADREVRRLLGAPHGESWFYPPKDHPLQRAATAAASSVQHECLAVRFETGVVVAALERNACKQLGIESGTSLIDVQRSLGSPPESCWQYSWSPRGGNHRMRMVCFVNGSVEDVIRRWAL